jgi:ABC-type transporter Mla MlaB component
MRDATLAGDPRMGRHRGGGQVEQPPSSAASSGPCGLEVKVDGLLAAHAVPRLCEQMVILVDCAGVGRLDVDLGLLQQPDLATVDALARLALAARRHQASVRVRTTNGALEQLLRLAGLEALVTPPRSVVEGGR